MDKENFWVEDPCILIKDCKIFPTQSMTTDEKLNAITRIIIIVAVIMYFMENKWWFVFLASSVIIVILIKYNKSSPIGKDTIKEGFTMTPTYNSPDFQQTVVAPLFAEEWQIPPPAYDLYVNIPPPNIYEEPLKPQSYPYGQYLTRTNLLPCDEYQIHLLNGGQRLAREYANSAYLRNDLAWRDNMTRIFRKKLERRYRHSNVHDTFSPYSGY